MASTVQRDRILEEVDRMPQVSWGAIFAGLFFLVAGSYLMYLFGWALGLSVADATNTSVVSQGLGIWTIVWMIFNCIVVYLLGGWLTARLSGTPDSTVGMLHGVALWGIGTTLMLLASWYGLSVLLETGQKALSAVSSAVTDTATAVGSGVAGTAQAVGTGADQLLTSPLGMELQAQLKREAAQALARSAAGPGEEQLTQQQAEQVVEQMDAELLQRVAARLAVGENQQARDVLTTNTDLTDQQIQSVLSGLSQQFEERIGQAEDDEALATDIQQTFRSRAASWIASVDQPGGPEVSQAEVRRAMQQLDPQVLQRVTTLLMNGKEQEAKNTLAANTNLTTQEIDEIVDGIYQPLKEQIDAFMTELEAAGQAVKDYAQAVLWTAFVAGAIALVSAIAGGALGANTTNRLRTEIRHQTTRRPTA